MRKKPKEWIPDAVWLNIVALSNMDAFRDIPDSVFRNDGLWRQWYDQEAPEMAKVGGPAAAPGHPTAALNGCTHWLLHLAQLARPKAVPCA